MNTAEIISIILSLTTIALLVFVILKHKPSGDNQQAIKIIKEYMAEQNNNTNNLNRFVLNAVNENNQLVLKSIQTTSNMQLQNLSDILARLDKILTTNDEQMKQATMVLETGLNRLQEGNEKKLEQMRQTVDEKLNVSLERRLGESFNVINQRLQEVYLGLGEMKSLANGVGDLKKVLTNVKTRGVWGEVQLGNLLEQMLSPDQYASQVVTNPSSSERVDFVVNLPGKDDKNVLLPIDAKFPIEDYQRLVEASEIGDATLVDACQKQLIKRIKDEAKSISTKYINVPNTTDFAIMYLSLEGLYAEVLRVPGLTESLQHDYKITVAGPTTLSALLNSLQLGFKTLAIQKRSGEVWGLLGTIKQEFGNFSVLLDKTQKKLNEASNTIESAARKSRTIERKLKNISLDKHEDPTELEFFDFEEDE